jgi:endonuclease G, mitochondrial
MSLIFEQIQKAEARLQGQDPVQMVAETIGKTPADLATPKEKADRHEFLRESLADETRADIVFERILSGNELQDVNYLARGARAAQSVARIAIREPSGRQVGWGSGFLIAPGVLITNNHVLSAQEAAIRSDAQFQYERDIEGELLQPASFALNPKRLFFTSKPLDFTVVAVEPRAHNSDRPLMTYGFLPLVGTLGKATEGEWLTIVQHPNGEQKQVCVRENKFIKKSDDALWYSTDTVGGSSGSPVFNNDWYVVALHHSGVPLKKDGRVQTVDGRDFDPRRDGDDQIKWIANEGIRVSCIVDALRRELPAHPLLQPVFNATPSNARIPEDGRPGRRLAPRSTVSVPTNVRANLETPMSANDSPKYVTVTLRVNPDGSVALDSAGAPPYESAAFEAKKSAKKPPSFDVPFNAKYDDRKGYNPDLLGGGVKRVNLPSMSPAVARNASELLEPEDGNKHVLRYHNYSVVMHAKRRFAIYSAANVSFGGRFDMSRPADVWRVDPRIPSEHQITNFYYKGNQFDRGHLTRREDLEFGPSVKRALQSAADTCHWTNCTPQHKGFNQNKELWQGIERHLLENAILADHFNAQVFTGPVLEEDDPVYDAFPAIQYPARFWKIVAALDSDEKLFATAFILDQSDVIEEFGIEEAVPIGAFKTFQVKVSEIERLTGLEFTSGDRGTPLSAVDPLVRPGRRPTRRRGRRSGFEEAALVGAPEGYVLLDSLDAIET